MPATSDGRVSITVTGLEREAFYTPKTLAQRLAISQSTVYDMLKRGVIPSYKVEGARRIDPADVDHYLRQRREERAA